MASNESSNKGDLVEKLRTRLQDVKPIPEEPNFFEKEETLMRFLKARNWDLKEAEKQLRSTIEWRRENKPLTTDCRWCHENPGTHSMRQVGFDELGRPVIYSCFAQARTKKNGVEDSVAHCTYLIENAKRSMKEGVGTWVFVIDCTGMTLPNCNPRLGYGCTQVFSNFYPERLGLVICVNHNPMFEGVWRAIKVFLDPRTADKVRLIHSKRKMRSTFDQIFSPELSNWMIEEIRRNRKKEFQSTQRQFWLPPTSPLDHDPRGSPRYVGFYVDNRMTAHKPHPCIEDFEMGRLLPSLPSAGSNNDLATDTAVVNGDEEDDENAAAAISAAAAEMEIPEEYQIPCNATHIG